MRAAGMVQTPASRSISSHVARRTSPDRAAVTTRNSNARLVVTAAWEARTVARASVTRAVGQRPHVLDDGLLPSERLPEGVARRVVRPVAHCDRPLHHGTDPLAHPPSPSIRGRPRMTSRCTHCRAPDGSTRKFSPWPSQ